MIRYDLALAGISHGEETIDADGVKRRTDWIDIHSLKGSYATRLMMLGKANDKVLEALVGHHSARTTKEHYIHLIPQDALDTLNRLPPLAIAPLPKSA
jgi:integrase